MNSSKYLRLVAAVIFLALAAYGGVFFLNKASPERETVTARLCTEEGRVSAEGTVIRDECLVLCPEAAYIAVSEGERVTGGSVIAVDRDNYGIFMRRSDQALSQELPKDAQSALALATATGDRLSRKKAWLKLTGNTVKGTRAHFSAATAPCGGIFSAYLDGCEGLTADNFDTYVPEIPADAVGRIVSPSGWIFAADIPADELGFSQGDRVTVKAGNAYSAVVSRIEDRDGTCRVFLRCRSGTEDVLSLRKLRADIVFYSREGIKVPLSALREEGGETYVYILAGDREQKIPVTVIYKNDSYCLIEEGALREGMKIITQDRVTEK